MIINNLRSLYSYMILKINMSDYLTIILLAIFQETIIFLKNGYFTFLKLSELILVQLQQHNPSPRLHT